MDDVKTFLMEGAFYNEINGKTGETPQLLAEKNGFNGIAALLQSIDNIFWSAKNNDFEWFKQILNETSEPMLVEAKIKDGKHLTHFS